MALSDQTVKLAEVAAALDVSEDYLRRHWRRLHETRGFPHKLNGWVWARANVEAWIATDGKTVAGETSPATASPGALAANQNKALSLRYAGGHA